MELNKKSQENSGSSTSFQADQMTVYMIDYREKEISEKIQKLDKDRDRKIEEIVKEKRKYAKVTINIPYEEFNSREENLLKHGLANFLQISIDEINIEMKERGSTSVTISLPSYLSDDTLEQLLYHKDKRIVDILTKIKSIKMLKNIDIFHNIKRNHAFNLYDNFLELCMNGICPSISKEHAYYLVDISSEGYITQRAYYYSIDNIGIDDKDRLCIAQRKGMVSLACTKTPSLNKEVFEKDQDQIKNHYYLNAVKRKAYWNMLSQKHKYADKDYNSAVYFVDKIKNLYDTGVNEKKYEAVQELKKLLVENLNIANALDMYKVCFLRQCLNEKLE